MTIKKSNTLPNGSYVITILDTDGKDIVFMDEDDETGVTVVEDAEAAKELMNLVAGVVDHVLNRDGVVSDVRLHKLVPVEFDFAPMSIKLR